MVERRSIQSGGCVKMKTFRKIIFSLFALILIFFLLGSINPNIKAEDVVTSEEISVLGAGVRTTGNAGIRFVGAVREYNTANIKAYGIAIAFGKAEANNDFVIGGTVNGKSVLSTTENVTLDDDNRFYVILYGVPESSYIQDVTARAYIVLNDDSIVYASTTTTRNLADVVVKAHDDEVTGDLITEVYDKIDRIAITENDYNIITENTINKYVNTLDTGKAFTLFEKEDAEMDDFVFVEGSKVFGTLSAANSALVDSDALYLFSGNYTENITISHTGIKLYGPNYDVVSTGERNTEAILSNTITLANLANECDIRGFKFIDSAIIKTTAISCSSGKTYNLKGFHIENCIVDKGTNTTSFISFIGSNRVFNKDVVIKGSSFTGTSIASPMIHLQDNENLNIDNCIFNNLNNNAIKVYESNNGWGLNGNLIVKNSRFTNIAKSAIWLNYVEPTRGTSESHQLLITNNYFESIESQNDEACIHIIDSCKNESFGNGFEISKNKFIDVYAIFKNAYIANTQFKLNYVYIHDNSSSWVARGIYQSTQKVQIYCTYNFYTTDGTTGITNITDYGVDCQLFNSRAMDNANTGNFATLAAYEAALEE